MLLDGFRGKIRHIRWIQIAGQPGGVEPDQVDRAEKAQNHPPTGAVAKQLAPIRERGRAGLDLMVGEITRIGPLKPEFGRRTVEGKPDAGDRNAGESHDGEHRAPTKRGHEQRDERCGKRRADRGTEQEHAGR